jgi:hypothetical protein
MLLGDRLTQCGVWLDASWPRRPPLREFAVYFESATASRVRKGYSLSVMRLTLVNPAAELCFGQLGHRKPLLEGENEFYGRSLTHHPQSSPRAQKHQPLGELDAS